MGANKGFIEEAFFILGEIIIEYEEIKAARTGSIKYGS